MFVPGVTLRELERLAAAFDDVSDETGARYSAAAFVTFVRTEMAVANEQSPVHRETRQAGQRRRWTPPTALTA